MVSRSGMKAQQVIPFAGLGGPNGDTNVPEWYSEKLDLTRSEDVDGFEDVIKAMEKAKAVTPAYKDPETGEYVDVPNKTAVANPAWFGEGREETERGHALWTFAGSTYEPVNPMEMYGPLLAKLRQKDLTGVYGRVEVYKFGGEVHMDLILPDYTVDVDGTEYVLALTSGYSHDLNRGLYAQFMAYNTETGGEWRQLTDKRTCRHSKKATGKVATWWEDGLDRAETATHRLATVVDEAMHYMVPFEGMPYNVAGFFEGLGIPAWGEKSLADLAANRVKAANTGGAEPAEATALALYEGLADTLTTDFGGMTASTAATSHNKAANNLLFSPPSAEAKVISYWQTELAEQESLTEDEETQRAALGERFGDTQAAIEHYESTKASLKRILNESREDAVPAEEAEETDEEAEEEPETDGGREAGEVVA